MAENDNIYLLTNYTLGTVVTIEELRQLYPNLTFERISPSIYTVQVPSGQEEELNRLRQNVGIITEPALYGLNIEQALETSNISIFHDYPYGALRGNGILIGFVDTGIDYTNALFQNADGSTRINAIWDQTIASGDSGNAPQNYSYGRVYTQADINEALRSENPYSIVPSRDENGHGTYVAGIAAGNDQSDQATYVGAAPDAGILMVKLRLASEERRNYAFARESVPFYQENDIMTGINFLLEQAFNLNQPIIICIGLGNNFGAHNGTALLEGYLQGISIASNVIAVVAAGNEGNSDHHYRGTVTADGTEEVEINVGENEAGFFVYLWAALPNKLEVAVRSPLGQVIDRVPIFNERLLTYSFKLEETELGVEYLYPEPYSGNEAVILRFSKPTPGIWTVIVYADGIVTGEYHMWLPRRGLVGETTRFLRPDPQTTVQIPGTGDFTIVVGAYDNSDDSVYAASGRGPTTSNVIKPDIVAPGVNVRGPIPGGGFTSFAGTSTAAAITAGACALLMQWAVGEGNFPEMNTRIARGILTRGARRQRGVIYPNNTEGYGRLDLQNSINLL